MSLVLVPCPSNVSVVSLVQIRPPADTHERTQHARTSRIYTQKHENACTQVQVQVY